MALILREQDAALVVSTPLNGPGRTLHDGLTKAASILTKKANDFVVAQLGRGPEKLSEKIVKYLACVSPERSLGREDKELVELCRQLMRYASPPKMPSTQLTAFKIIIALVTEYFSFKMRAFLLHCLRIEDNGQVAHSRLASCWETTEDPSRAIGLDFFLDLAVSSVCGTDGLASCVESTPKGMAARIMPGEQHSLIHVLLIATNSRSKMESSLAVRYLAGVLKPSTFWHLDHKPDHLLTATRVIKRTRELVEDLPSGDKTSGTQVDFEGVDLLAVAVLGGLRQWDPPVTVEIDDPLNDPLLWVCEFHKILIAVVQQTSNLPNASALARSDWNAHISVDAGDGISPKPEEPQTPQQIDMKPTMPRWMEMAQSKIRTLRSSHTTTAHATIVEGEPPQRLASRLVIQEDLAVIESVSTAQDAAATALNNVENESSPALTSLPVATPVKLEGRPLLGYRIFPTKRSDHGFKVLAEGADPIVDVVLLHGLDGHRLDTFTEGGVCWPRDLLPAFCPQARIATYGYNAATGGNVKQLSAECLYAHGQTLLAKLVTWRKITQTTHRPIVFIAYSVGGLVLKHALIQANDAGNTIVAAATRTGASGEAPDESNLIPKDACLVKTSTYGVVFLGTPHQSIPLQTLGEFFQNLAAFGKEAAGNDVLQAAEHLYMQLDSFTNISDHFDTKLAYEVRKTTLSDGKLAMLVPKATAVLPGVVNTQSIGMERDHFDIATFTRTDDNDFKTLTSWLQDMIRKAPTQVERNFAALTRDAVEARVTT